MKTFHTLAAPVSLAFSTDGSLVAVANKDADTITMYGVDYTDNLLTQREALLSGSLPDYVTFSPTNTTLLAANSKANTVTIFSVHESAG